MRFGVLGPLAVTTDAGEPVTVPGVKVRALLADLLANRNQVVSADRLIDDLWGDDPPANPAGALQVRVSQLRKALNDAEPGARDLVESRPPGYLLRATADADRFAELAAAGDVARLTEALGLWRGEPYADFADSEYVRAETIRLTEQRLAVLERLADARLARGEHDLVAADLAELVARHPLREGLRALHLRALYAAGRQTEALESYADLRDRLADELGLDPGPELVALHRRILAQDADLTGPPRAARIRNSIPARLNELVGRAEALTELRTLIPQQRLVTLTGPGGVGKTRLATEAAREQARPDGVHLVELAALPPGDPGVADRILAVLDVHEAAGVSVPAADRLLAAIRQRRLLLVLDNCEHVIEPAAGLVARLLRDAPDVTVLATSREPLGLTGELVWEVPPLAVPDDDRDPDAVRRSAAARLFAARAAAQQRGFRLDDRTAPAVAQLCRRLDGMPLALELAATRVRALGVTGVVERLDDRFKVLATQQRDVPARHRTLAAVIGWSWDLLDDPDRRVLARLAVFSGGCTLDAAEVVCDADVEVLTRLVDRSLVVMDDTGTGPRYRLLESVAAFCLDRLDTERPGEAAAVRARHAAYYTSLAERADPELRGPGQAEWLVTLDAENANLRSALAHGGGLRLAVALTWYWFLRGRFSEARRALTLDGDSSAQARAAAWRVGFALLQGDRLETADISAYDDSRGTWFVAAALIHRSELTRAAELLAAAEGSADRWTAAAVLSSRAKLAHAAGDLAALDRDGTRCAQLFAELGDRWGRLQASDWVGGLAELTGEYDRAAALHREGLGWAEELSLWPEVSSKLSWLAWLAVQTRDYVQARELAERAYRLAAEQDSGSALVFAELSLGFAARRDGKLDVATTHLEHLVELARREAQPALFLPMVLVELGYAAEHGGDPATGLARHVEAFDVAQAMGAPRDAIGALEGIASATAWSEPEVAARLLGAAAAARRAAEFAAAPAERDELDRIGGRLVAVLGRERFDTLVAAGHDLSPDAARALV
ncbi:BTAD domain-containing putative transcriptional regulator [Micromonospora sp. 4G57]|uniref:BTAD domain-containing putative transcriptional regulator n=1 Tax=Micromonospora sicca TaxID=2202420 RepID=A0ABU5JCD6_9ACTN|nr:MULTISPECIES: BTAD domain-containing putative transcriptional regulator [unclassified Micromonospora]MDZ5441687.1 BTAD domain-containing putative transcriptional regulator [Micromonospora sp. 4G57]MDZ5490248.1 BTAD domain-containing putative transcriptional regulator [Micromonospora sp. 4G53]